MLTVLATDHDAGLVAPEGTNLLETKRLLKLAAHGALTQLQPLS